MKTYNSIETHKKLLDALKKELERDHRPLEELREDQQLRVLTLKLLYEVCEDRLKTNSEKLSGTL